MTATLTAPVEALLREQVAKGDLPSMDRALEVAVKAVDGRRASHALESPLDEARAPLATAPEGCMEPDGFNPVAVGDLEMTQWNDLEHYPEKSKVIKGNAKSRAEVVSK